MSSRSLVWLSLANNNLKQIGQNAGPFPRLQYLDLRSNDLTDLKGLTASNSIFPCLAALDLSDNSLRDLRGLEGLVTIEALSLDNNDLGDDAVEELCNAIDKMKGLRFLTCEENDWSVNAEQILEDHVRAVNRERQRDIDLYT